MHIEEGLPLHLEDANVFEELLYGIVSEEFDDTQSEQECDDNRCSSDECSMEDHNDEINRKNWYAMKTHEMNRLCDCIQQKLQWMQNRLRESSEYSSDDRGMNNSSLSPRTFTIDGVKHTAL